MGVGKFFKALFGGHIQQDAVKAARYVEYQKQSIKGKLVASHRQVSVVTPTEGLRLHLAELLKPVVEELQYIYKDRPSLYEAAGSQILIVDGTPTADARLHTKYDKIICLKKSMGKVYDVLCVIGRRQDYKKYPRGTYPNVLYFCIKEDDLNHRDPDLPPEGTDTIAGPRLYNLPDLPTALAAKIREFSGFQR